MRKNKCSKCGKVWYCNGNDESCNYSKDDCACPICIPIPKEFDSRFQCREHKNDEWRIA